MNKEEVCVKLTRKNVKKVFWILEMFAEPVYSETRLSLKNGNHLNEGYPFVYWNGHYWVGSNDENKTLIKPRELRNILAKNHLKAGDIFIGRNTDQEFVGVFSKIETESCSKLFAVSNWRQIIGDIKYENETNDSGWFEDFVRFATDEEKALLEPKQTIETVDPVNSFTGSIPGKITYNREVYVNHYSDREFYVHYDEQSAYMSIGRRGEGTTVKATLTYDIPMTKV